MLEFTDSARQAPIRAKQLAGDESYVRPGHLLLGILESADPIAISMLKMCGVNILQLQSVTEKELKKTKYESNQETVERTKCPAMSLAVSRVITLSIHEAKVLRHNYVGIEHLLLALLHSLPDGVFRNVVTNDPELVTYENVYENAVEKLKEIFPNAAIENTAIEDSLIISSEVQAHLKNGIEILSQLQLWVTALERSIVKHTTLLQDIQSILVLDNSTEEKIEKIKNAINSV